MCDVATKCCFIALCSEDVLGVIVSFVSDVLRPESHLNMSYTNKKMHHALAESVYMLHALHYKVQIMTKRWCIEKCYLRSSKIVRIGTDHNKPLTIQSYAVMGTLFASESMCMCEHFAVTNKSNIWNTQTCRGLSYLLQGIGLIRGSLYPPGPGGF